MRISGATDIGLSRETNQDAFGFRECGPGLCFAVVCDGMGGMLGGDTASRIAVDTVMETVGRRCSDKVRDNEIHRALQSALTTANKRVLATAAKDPLHLGGMGTTVVAAVINGRVLHLSHLGDSRAYSFVSGKLTQLTRDHSLVQDMVEKGQITPAQAISHPQRNIITRVIGYEKQFEEDYRCMAMQPGETVLLCTDGLTNSVRDEDIAAIMSKYRFENIAAQLIKAALAGGGDDNITALVMRAEEA